MLVWNNAVMGLRDEVRIDGLLIQTWFSPVHNGRTVPTGILIRYGLRVLDTSGPNLD